MACLPVLKRPPGLSRAQSRPTPTPPQAQRLTPAAATGHADRSCPKPIGSIRLPHGCTGWNVWCVRETEILVEHQPPQGVFVCNHAGLVINKFSQVGCEENYAATHGAGACNVPGEGGIEGSVPHTSTPKQTLKPLTPFLGDPHTTDGPEPSPPPPPPLGPLRFKCSQHSPTTRPSIERTADEAFLLSGRV